MSYIFNLALDVQTIRDLLSDMEYYNYSDEVRNCNCFPYYEELFIDISLAASKLSNRFEHLCRYLPDPPDNKNSGFNSIAMILNYNKLDYYRAADTCMSNDAEEYEENNMASLAVCSKKEQRYLFISVFEFMVEFLQLKVTYKTLVELLQGFDFHNSDDVFRSGGAQ